MMWLNDEGIIGEIECIFPKQLDKEISLVKNQKILTQQGFPLIDNETEITVHEISIFKGANYFTLYLTKSANYNKEIISENLVFYLHDMELIAIKATVSE